MQTKLTHSNGSVATSADELLEESTGKLYHVMSGRGYINVDIFSRLVEQLESCRFKLHFN